MKSKTRLRGANGGRAVNPPLLGPPTRPMRPKKRFLEILTILLGCASVRESHGNPDGLTVRSGTATITLHGNQLDVTVSRNAFLDWHTFNIGDGETTTFHQPSAASVVWNRINDPNPSQIFGHINANGIVVLMNQAGFYFGPNSVVRAASFVATTAMTLPTMDVGGTWHFNGPPPLASIVNYGEVQVQSGGSLFMIAEKVENHGTLSAPDGTLGLYAGKRVLMSERPDGRGLSVRVELPEGSVDNRGQLIADGGSVLLHAQTVNQDGLIQANSVREQNGVIELIASDSITLGANSRIRARGDDSTVSGGGQITIKSGGAFYDTAGGSISIAGSDSGGNGGRVEISAPFMPGIHSQIEGTARAGYIGGSLLIDPTDINLNSTGTGSSNGGNVGANDPPGTLNLNVNSAFVGLSQITLQATRNITLQTGTIWDLNLSTGISSPGCVLSLQAGNNITVQTGASIKAEHGWTVSMLAGADFSNPGTVLSGIGSILFQGTGSLEAFDGNINLEAGQNVTVAGGFVRTIGGGSIAVHALAGTVNTGTRNNGFLFRPTDDVSHGGYLLVDPDLGGISTAAGGDVFIHAGQDIVSLLPTGTQSNPTDAGSGAFGTQAGNVTLISDNGNVNGHYVVRNGTGTIIAGNNAGIANHAGTGDRPLALSLVAGGWNVTAARDIVLQEVRNPNGIFNSLNFGGRSDTASKHYFDYSPDAYVDMTAGDGVQILGGGPRRAGTFEQSIPAIYAPTLEITAGAGGVQVANEIRLFPSADGQLSITTTSGGSLVGNSADLVSIVMSDSSRSQYSSSDPFDFGPDDHAATPIHLNDPEPVRLDISGDMNSILLVSPKRTEITVGGDMNNSRFAIQNLHATDVSTVNVARDIRNRTEFTTIAMNTAPNLTPLLHAYPELPPELLNLAGKLHYDAQTHQLTFQGRMTDEELQALTSLQIQAYDPVHGTPLFDLHGNPILQTVAVLAPEQAQALFDASQSVPLTPGTGYAIAGPGSLNLTAHSMDLGATLGLQSVGPANNHALAPLGNSGSDINVRLTGDLDMFSSTISSLAGGNVNVYADGTINVGSSVFTGDELARGIFTVAKSDVTVIAGGDINVNGSRIAAYDGGNILIRSLTGDVNAGQGGLGAVEVEKVIIDPITHEVRTYTPTIPGSGILAATFPPSLNPGFPNSQNIVGNIVVETPQGNITASSGGIVQVALNGTDTHSPSVTLVAGTKDAQGNVIYHGSIDASGSGVIGANVNLEATDGVQGLVVAQHDINITSGQNVNVTAIGAGNVNVSAGGSISGTIVGVGSVNASGGSIDASLLSQNVSSSGSVGASAQLGFGVANTAGATSQSASSSTEDAQKTLAKKDEEDPDEKKKKGNGGGPTVARRVGRVTVILPKS